jgi:bacteriocin-like protein
MIPTLTELTDKELDAVSGGSSFTLSAINQQNFAQTIGVAVNAVTAASAATVAQLVTQTNSIL